MEKKRSIGVAIFAWLFIVTGAMGILGSFINMLVPFNRAFIDRFTFWQGIVGSVCYLVAGIGLFNLKSWGRKLIIVLCALYIALIPWSYHRSLEMFKKVSAMQDKIFQQQMGQSEGGRSAQALEEFRRTMDAAMSVSIKLGIVVGFVWNAGIIFYFTRPKVRTQFESEVKPTTIA